MRAGGHPTVQVVTIAGFPVLGLSRVPPLYLSARPGRALLGGGSPSPSPPSSAARVRHAQPFRGSPLLRCLVDRVRLLARASWYFVPPSFLCVDSIDGAGLSVTGPPTNAAGAAPVKCGHLEHILHIFSYFNKKTYLSFSTLIMDILTLIILVSGLTRRSSRLVIVIPRKQVLHGIDPNMEKHTR